jgi:MGT family glycosyltransferase
MPNNVSYVGRIKSSRRTNALTTTEPDRSDLPLVVVSYSTDRLQNSPERLQVALDGLSDLPVRVFATTSGTFEPERLSVPANATVFDDMSHEQLMREAQVVVAHAGHGTTLAALCHGVPMVCVPGVGRDQIPIARRVAELGLGIALASQSSAREIRSAVTAVRGDPSYRRRATEFVRRCGDPDGARAAADIVEERLIAR